jgi:hypothetical protein
VFFANEGREERPGGRRGRDDLEAPEGRGDVVAVYMCGEGWDGRGGPAEGMVVGGRHLKEGGEGFGRG